MPESVSVSPVRSCGPALPVHRPRFIARLDVKGETLIKTIRLEGLRVLGRPEDFADRYYRQGVDELLFHDAVASLYQRNQLSDVIARTAAKVFVPITVGGGIRSVDDARRALSVGADKVAINSAAVARPGLISEIAERFGRQCMVLAIDAKQMGPGHWEPYVDGGRERTHLDAVAWAKQGVERGAGEILVTAIDREGTFNGPDLELAQAIAAAVAVPVILSGGIATTDHAVSVFVGAGVGAVACAGLLHYGRAKIADLKAAAKAAGFCIADHDVRSDA